MPGTSKVDRRSSRDLGVASLMCVCVCVCLCVCVCVLYIYICIDVYICIYICIYLHAERARERERERERAREREREREERREREREARTGSSSLEALTQLNKATPAAPMVLQWVCPEDARRLRLFVGVSDRAWRCFGGLRAAIGHGGYSCKPLRVGVHVVYVMVFRFWLGFTFKVRV